MTFPAITTDLQKLLQGLDSHLGFPIYSYSSSYPNTKQDAEAFIKAKLSALNGHYTATMPSTLFILNQIREEIASMRTAEAVKAAESIAVGNAIAYKAKPQGLPFGKDERLY